MGIFMINKTSLKFIGGFVLIVALAMGGLYALNYYFSPEQKAIRYYKNLERQYAEDTYGGKTPEETLQLFIDALKAGDIELASKYFVVEKQGEWQNNLTEIKTKNLLDEMVFDLQRPKDRKDVSNDKIIFYIYNDNNQLAIAISIGKISNSIWKIIDM
ncbi:MAG: hypothetical protein HYW09_00800 [Candidatus Niyogibacteria bacterium]|nr:hypothetical protein [Candidatus Niyogibacteria bacterium]